MLADKRADFLERAGAVRTPLVEVIRIEFSRPGGMVTVHWPLSAVGHGVPRCCGDSHMIRIDAAWLPPLDMRVDTDTALARVVAVFGAARPHHAYLFANKRANRIKIQVHDGIGI